MAAYVIVLAHRIIAFSGVIYSLLWCSLPLPTPRCHKLAFGLSLSLVSVFWCV